MKCTLDPERGSKRAAGFGIFMPQEKAMFINKLCFSVRNVDRVYIVPGYFINGMDGPNINVSVFFWTGRLYNGIVSRVYCIFIFMDWAKLQYNANISYLVSSKHNITKQWSKHKPFMYRVSLIAIKRIASFIYISR